MINVFNKQNKKKLSLLEDSVIAHIKKPQGIYKENLSITSRQIYNDVRSQDIILKINIKNQY